MGVGTRESLRPTSARSVTSRVALIRYCNFVVVNVEIGDVQCVS